MLLAMGLEGTDVQMPKMLYTTIVKAVILYRSEKRIMYPRIGNTLGRFHYWVVRRLTGRMPQWNLARKWWHPPLEEAMSEVGIQEVYTYTTCRQITAAKFIATRPIMDLCLEATRRPRA